VALALKSGRHNPEFRLELIFEVFGISKHAYPAGISDFVRDPALKPGLRSAITFLAIKGRYPSAAQVEDVVALLEATEFDKAIEKILRGTSFRDTRRLLVPSNEMLIDVTRYSRTSEMSGIPRVVRNLITSTAAKDASFGVWSDQVLGPVQISILGSVHFGKAVWGNLRGSHYLYFILRKLYFSKSSAIAHNKLISKILKLMNRMLFGRFLLRMVDIQAPRVGYIIGPQNLMIPEVPDAVNSELLRVWIDNVELKNTRCIVHDLLPLTHPQFFPKHAFSEHQEYLKLLNSCDTLVVGTPVLAEELRNSLDTNSADSRIECLPLPVSLKSNSESITLQDVPRLTFSGGYQARKGLKFLVDFLDTCDKSSIHFKVAVVGSPNLLSGREEDLLFSRIMKRQDIFEVHESLHDSMLADLIKTSAAILYISGAEGYGLPVLEALSLGVPVIAAGTPVNLHFSSEYGGIHLLSEKLSLQDLDALNEIARRGELWQSLKSSINTSRLPCDVEKWARDFLTI